MTYFTKIALISIFLVFVAANSAGAGIVNNAGTLTGEDSLCVSMALLDSLGSPTAVDSTTDWMKIIIFKADGDSVFADSMMIDEGDAEVEIWKLGASGTDFNQVFTYSVSIADIDGTATGTLAARNGTYRYAIYCRDSSLKLFTPYFGEFQLVSTGTDLSPTTALTDAAALTFSTANVVDANTIMWDDAAITDADGTPDVDATAISGDATAANNAESFFDGVGYAGTNNVIPTVTTVTNSVGTEIAASEVNADVWTELWASTGGDSVLNAIDDANKPNFRATGFSTFNAASDSVFADKSSLADLNIKVNSADTIQADVLKWLGTAAATPSVAGVPEVDVTHYAGTAQAPTQAGIPDVNVYAWLDGLTQPGALTGAGLVPSDAQAIAAAVQAALAKRTADSTWKAGIKGKQTGDADSTFADAFINTGGQAYAIVDFDTSGGTLNAAQFAADYWDTDSDSLRKALGDTLTAFIQEVLDTLASQGWAATGAGSISAIWTDTLKTLVHRTDSLMRLSRPDSVIYRMVREVWRNQDSVNVDTSNIGKWLANNIVNIGIDTVAVATKLAELDEDNTTIDLDGTTVDSALVSRIVGRKVWGLETSGADSSNATQRKVNMEMVDDSASSATNLMYAFNTQIDSLAHLDLRRLTVLDTGTSDGGAALFRHTNKQPGFRIQTSGTSAVAAFDIRNTGTGGSAIGMRVASVSAHGANFLTTQANGTQYDLYLDTWGIGGGGAGNPYIINNPAAGRAVQTTNDVHDDGITAASIANNSFDAATFASDAKDMFSDSTRKALGDTLTAFMELVRDTFDLQSWASTAVSACQGDGIVSCTLDVRNSAGGLAGVDVGIYNTSNAFLYGDESDNNGFVYFNLDASTTYRVKAGGLPGSVHDSLPYQTLVTTSATNIRDTVPMTTNAIPSPTASNFKRVYDDLSNFLGTAIQGANVIAELLIPDSTVVPYDTSSGFSLGKNPVFYTTQSDANGRYQIDLIPNDYIRPQGSRYKISVYYERRMLYSATINATGTATALVRSLQ